MQQPQMKTSKPQMKYKVRAGTIDSGKKYEYKMAALLSLRCVLNDEDMWISSNADGVGAFDDIVLCQGNTTFMLQLKHKENPKPLVERDFLGQRDPSNVDGVEAFDDTALRQGNRTSTVQLEHKYDPKPLVEPKKAEKGDFLLRKYIQDIVKLKKSLESKGKKSEIIKYLGSLENICFALFTNRVTNACEFLEESSDIPPFLKTSSKEHKINVAKVTDLLNVESTAANIYLLSNQIHAKYIDVKISEEIQKLAEHFKLKDSFIKRIAEAFTKYVTDWAEGTLGGHYCLTKSDVISKLTELFYCQYEIKLDREKFTFYTCEKKQIWNNIVQDKTVTVIDFEDKILKFLFEYVGLEVSTYCKQFNAWIDIFTAEAQNTFYQEHSSLKGHMLKIVGNQGKITLLDIYKCLWMNKQLPLLLEINSLQQYDDILHILKLSNYEYKVIVINKCSEVLPQLSDKKIIKCFTTVHDLNEENRKQILTQEVKLQGRSPVTLEKLIDEDMFQYIKCNDIVNILSGYFSIGNNLNLLPDYFISRSVSKVFLLSKVLDVVLDELFLIESTSENYFEILSLNNSKVLVCQLEAIDVNKLNRGGIILSSRSATPEEIEKLKSTNRHVHYLKIYNENYLEWKASFGSVKSLRQFQTSLEDITESCIANKFNSPTNIISAVPGMGKSVLMNFVALQTPANKWVLRIDLNGHQSYYKTNACKSSTTKGLEHLEYFKESHLNQLSGLTQLSNAVFKKLSKAKDVIVLLDGFDEISLLYKTEVTNIAKKLHNEGYYVWLTTRPYMSSHLENEFDTFSITLKSFSLINQKEFLTNYFCAENVNFKSNSKTLIKEFVEKLLKAAEKNLNDWDAEFTGIPLQTKLLADAFKVDCINYVSTKGVDNFNENFDLLYLYQTFIDNKIDILCNKFGPSAEDNRFIIKEHQSCFALKLLFSQHENLLLYQHVTEEFNAYYKGKPDRIELLQREGVVIVDSDFNVNFVHRTYGEYLAALWLAENLKSSGQRKELAHILIKERFTQNYKFLFGLFDRILSKGFPLHLAVINNKEEEILEMLNANSETIKKEDAGERSVLHVIALYSCQFPKLFQELQQYFITNKALKFLDQEIFNTDKMLHIVGKVLNCNIAQFKNLDLLGYSPLDYALANQSLSVANKIIKHFTSMTINANISLGLKKHYVVYCALLDYSLLFNALLPYFLSKDLLFDNVDKNDLISSYVKKIFHISKSYYASDVDNQNIRQKISYFNLNCEVQYKDKTVLQLLQPTNEIKWKWNSTVYTDIRYAVCFGSEGNVHRLLINGARVNQQDTEYNTPLHYAVLHQKTNIVDMILSKYPEVELNKQNSRKNTPLHLAFTSMTSENSFGSLLTNSRRNRIVKKLITMQANTNIKNYVHVTPFHLAVENRKRDWVKLFISSDADINIQDGKGNNALHLAAIGDYNDILSIILNNAKNVKINMEDYEGETVLFRTIRNNNIDGLRLLLDKGADVNLQNIFGETALHLAATYGYNEALREILSRSKIVDVNVIDNYGWTPFSCALFNTNIETVKILLDADVNLDMLDEKGRNLLQFAVTGGHKNILSTVLVNGSSIDINRQDKDGRTLLFNAVKNNDQNKAMQLLRLEAKVDIQDKNGLTVFHLFADNGSMNLNDTIIQILNKNFTYINGNIQDNEGRTPLYYAVQNYKKKTVEILLANGADVNVRDTNGISSLHLIASRGYNDILSVLLAGECKMDINIIDNNGRTPLHYAIQENNKKTVALFLYNNADINIPDKYGTTSLHLISSRGYPDILSTFSISDNFVTSPNAWRPDDPNIRTINT